MSANEKLNVQLFDAAKNGRTNQMRWLITQGADVNARDSELWTPLHFAVRDNKPESVALLVTSGADVDAQDGRGWTPLHCASTYHSIRSAQLLVDNGARSDIRNHFGLSPLDMAEQDGRTQIVTLLQVARNEVADPNNTSGSRQSLVTNSGRSIPSPRTK